MASALLAVLTISSPLAGAPASPPGHTPARAASPEPRSVDSPGGSGSLRESRVGAQPSNRRRFIRAKRAGRSGVVVGLGGPGRDGPPHVAMSHYLRTASPGRLQRLGCLEGRRIRALNEVPDAMVVLAFGRPLRRQARWGASLFGDRFHSAEVIREAAHAYALGYRRCNGRRTKTRLLVALGTSNYGRGVTFRHGRAWARMVNEANERLQKEGLAPKVTFAGASDIELGWNGPTVSKRWVRGYDSAAKWPFYNFGDAAGCPPRGNCLGEWKQRDVWYVSWGTASAWPLPQIYTESGSMAQQWYQLSLYSFRRHGVHMTIVGALSQRRACRQSDDSCWGMNNSPIRAWRQLQRLLNGDPRTAQRLRWLTDLRWEG
jgi:hypothetical protein